MSAQLQSRTHCRPSRESDIVTFGNHGAGVTELIDEMPPATRQSRAAVARHNIPLGKSSGGERSDSPFRVSALAVGTSGAASPPAVAGSSSVCAPRATASHHPEGDYDSVESARAGNPEHAPTIEECLQLLNKPDQNVVINLLGVKLEDRPWFFLSLFSRIRELRARTGRPHWLIVDEAHHAIPASWRPTDQNLPERLEGVVMVSVSPNLIAPAVCARSIHSSCSATNRAKWAPIHRQIACLHWPMFRARSRPAQRCSGTRRRLARRLWFAWNRAAPSDAVTCVNMQKARCRRIAAFISAGPSQSSTCARRT